MVLPREPESGSIDPLSGREVKVTGGFRRSSLDMTQKELEQVLRSRGAIPAADIRRTTHLLIRARSSSWKYGLFGDREAELLSRSRGGSGVVIHVDDLAVLLQGGAVRARSTRRAWQGVSARSAIPPGTVVRGTRKLVRASSRCRRTCIRWERSDPLRSDPPVM